MASESNNLFSLNLVVTYILIFGNCLKYETFLYINGTENLSPTWWHKKKLHNLINHNTNLNDPWLRTLDHNSFQTC